MSRVTNYELRSRVFHLDDTERILQLYKLYRRVEYCKAYNLPLPVEYHSEVHDDDFLFLQAFYPSEWSECEKIFCADKERVRRLKIKVRYMLTISRCYFCTFTFSDSVLSLTSSKTRRRYVTRWLTSLDCAYIANLDFGADNGREHYHALVAVKPSKSKLSEWILNYGLFHVEPVRSSLTSSVCLSKYVSKLCNHSVKVTCKRSALLFSRKYKLPSTQKEFKNLVAPILGKGNVLGIPCTTSLSRSCVLRPSLSSLSHSLVARCCMCGSIIPVLPSDMSKHTLTAVKGTKTKKYYFCSDCKSTYNVKTDN